MPRQKHRHGCSFHGLQLQGCNTSSRVGRRALRPTVTPDPYCHPYCVPRVEAAVLTLARQFAFQRIPILAIRLGRTPRQHPLKRCRILGLDLCCLGRSRVGFIQEQGERRLTFAAQHAVECRCARALRAARQRTGGGARSRQQQERTPIELRQECSTRSKIRRVHRRFHHRKLEAGCIRREATGFGNLLGRKSRLLWQSYNTPR